MVGESGRRREAVDTDANASRNAGVFGPADKKEKKPGRVMWTIFGVLVGLMVLAIVFLLWYFSHITAEDWLEEEVTVPGSFFLTRDQAQVVSLLIAVPGLLAVTALVFGIIGYLQVRAALSPGHRKWWQGGAVQAKARLVSTPVHLAWVGFAVVCWIALIIVPTAIAAGGGWPMALAEEPMTYVFLTLGCYGGLSAALAAVMAVSLWKKAAYRREIARRGPEAEKGGPGKDFWRWFTFRWRFDLWLAGLGGVFLGAAPLALVFQDLVFFTTALVIGAVLGILGVLTAGQYWRAGQELGTSESFA